MLKKLLPLVLFFVATTASAQMVGSNFWKLQSNQFLLPVISSWGIGSSTISSFFGTSTVTNNLLVAGNVGIGTTTPQNPLHLWSTTTSTLRIDADALNTGSEETNPNLILTQDGGFNLLRLGIGGTAGTQYTGQIINASFLEAKAQGDLQLVTGGISSSTTATDGTARITIQADGDIGFGTSTPVNGTYHFLKATGDAILLVQADPTNVPEDDNPQIRLSQDGNLVNGIFGIGGSTSQYNSAIANATFIEAQDNGGASPLQFVTGGNIIGGTAGTARMTILYGGNIGIGNTAPSSKLYVSATNDEASVFVNTYTGTSGSHYGNVFQTTITPTGAEVGAQDFITNNSRLYITGANTFNGSSQGRSFYMDAQYQGSQTFGDLRGAFIDIYNTATGTLSNAYGAVILHRNTGAGTTTNAYGVQVRTPVKSAGSITNFTGFDAQNPSTVTGGTNIGYRSQVASASNNYNIYADGTAKNYFAGSVGIGTSAPVQKFQVVGASAQATTTTGTADGIVRLVPTGSTLVMDFGAVGTNAHGWIQARQSNAYGTSFPIVLNPVGGNVGIGTNAATLLPVPVAKFAINATSSNPATSTAYSTSDGAVFKLINENRAVLGIGSYASGNYWLQAGVDSAANRDIVLNPLGGNVGIGTTVPSSTLQIGTPLNATHSYLQLDFTTSTPSSADCDAQNEVGRTIMASTTARLIYTCWGTAGWATSTPSF